MQKLKLKREYKKYSEYKDSEFEWIGKIPEEWEKRKVKYVGKTIAGGTPSTSEASFWDGDISWLPSGAVQNRIVNKKKAKYITKLALQRSAAKLIKPNSVLVALTGATCANVGFLPFESTANQSVVAIHNNDKTFSKYLYYSFLSNREQFLIYKTGGAQSGINENNIKNIYTAFPDKNDQQKIAGFLDEKTELIDKIIERKKKLIELLKEKRTAMINQAVTRGLDPNAELVDSGVEWVGKIPKDWKTLPSKRLVKIKITDGPHVTPTFIDDGIPFVSVESIKDNKINFDYRRGNISFEDHKEFCKKCHPVKDDLFIVKSGSTTGKIAIVDVDFEFSVWSPLALVRADKKKVLPYFLFYSFQNDSFQKQIQLFWSFGTQPNIGMNVIEKLIVAVPPIEMQKQIIKYLEYRMFKADSIIENIQKSINLLTEFKSSLIANVVTGKIKV